MDSVVRLVKTYIWLCRDGCLLFLDFSVKFYFDCERAVCCVVAFHSHGTPKQLKGCQTPDQTLEHYMAKVRYHFYLTN